MFSALTQTAKCLVPFHTEGPAYNGRALLALTGSGSVKKRHAEVFRRLTRKQEEPCLTRPKVHLVQHPFLMAANQKPSDQLGKYLVKGMSF